MSRDRDRIVYLPNRREVLIKGIADALAVAGFWSRTGTIFAGPGAPNGETPGLTEVPYWVDGQVERVDVRTDSATGIQQAGLPLYLGLTISQITDTAPYTITPSSGAKVDIWCCNAQGVYSDEAVENTAESDYLRGYQVSNDHGVVEFLTTYPGWYSGRTRRIQVRVRTYDATGAQTYNWTSQFYFDDSITNAVYAANSAYARPRSRDTTNATDNVYSRASANGSPEEEAGDYMLLKLADDGNHAMGSFHIVLDLSDTANADATSGSEIGGDTGVGGTSPGVGGPGGSGAPPTPSVVTASSSRSAQTSVATSGTTKSNSRSSISANAKVKGRGRRGR
jgi:protocatechuate 3,4-dioxygenase beta subunit